MLDSLSCSFKINILLTNDWEGLYGGGDRMIIGFTTFYICNQCLSLLKLRVRIPAHGVVHSIQHYVITFVSDLRQVGGFLSAPSVSSTNKTDRHDITIKQTIMIESLSKNKSVLYVDFYRGRRIQTSDMLMPFVNE